MDTTYIEITDNWDKEINELEINREYRYSNHSEIITRLKHIENNNKFFWNYLINLNNNLNKTISCFDNNIQLVNNKIELLSSKFDIIINELEEKIKLLESKINNE